MRDPVTCADGHSYVRASIELWLATHNTSPKTGAQLLNKALTPNHALRNAIEEWLAEAPPIPPALPAPPASAPPAAGATTLSPDEVQLKKVNETLWKIEDMIREKEKLQEFDNEFIELARGVYIKNDERARIKREINILCNSDYQEVKIY
jgi:hypothetical protein